MYSASWNGNSERSPGITGSSHLKSFASMVRQRCWRSRLEMGLAWLRFGIKWRLCHRQEFADAEALTTSWATLVTSTKPLQTRSYASHGRSRSVLLFRFPLVLMDMGRRGRPEYNSEFEIWMSHAPRADSATTPTLFAPASLPDADRPILDWILPLPLPPRSFQRSLSYRFLSRFEGLVMPIKRRSARRLERILAWREPPPNSDPVGGMGCRGSGLPGQGPWIWVSGRWFHRRFLANSTG